MPRVRKEWKLRRTKIGGVEGVQAYHYGRYLGEAKVKDVCKMIKKIKQGVD